MKHSKKSVVVPMVIVSTFGWAFFTTEAIKQNMREELNSMNKHRYTIEDIKNMSVSEQVKESHQDFYDEYERLKEEERKRLEELERQRLLKLEQERLAEIARVEAEKKKQREIEEAKKKALTSQNEIVYNDNSGGWRTFEATYYSAFCDTCGGQGLTASGISVANSIYYKGYRVIATNQNEIPMYSIVEVKTHYGTFKAVSLDTGGFGKGGVDVLVDSTETAYSLGRHNVQIRVIGKYNK